MLLIWRTVRQVMSLDNYLFLKEYLFYDIGVARLELRAQSV